ncbi:MAG: YkyA family protein [Tuberibacillus sp.]
MLNNKRKIRRALFFTLLSILLLSGCSGQSNAEKAFTYLEKSASKEEGFNQQQQPLVKEEKAEQDLYDKIMALDMTKYDLIKDYSNQALKHIDEREKMIEKEKQSINDAYDMFNKAVPYINKVENKDAKQHGDQMIADMKKRYQAFQNLYQAYHQSIGLDRDLFNMLADKSLTKDALEKHLTKVNDTYEKIEQQKDEFNQMTQSFNKEKNSFYKILKLGDAK